MLWSCALPAQAAERYRDAVLADHPIAYFRLDERSGAIAHDSSGHHFDGVIGARVSRGRPGVIPDAASSLGFNGGDRSTKDDVVRVRGNAMFERAQQLTIEAWVVPDTTKIVGNNSGDVTLAAYGNDDAPDKLHCRYALELDEHSHVLYFPLTLEGKKTDRVQVTGLRSLATWLRQPFAPSTRETHMLYAEPGTVANPPQPRVRYHLVGTYNGETMRFYVNGRLNREMHVRGRVVGYAARNGFSIGGEYVDLNPVFRGRIGEVAVYPSTLSEARVRAHYRIGIGEAAADQRV